MTDPETDPTGPIGELPAAGDTSPGERTDTRTPDASGTTLTIAEAAERFDVSAVTLRRRIRAGEIAGATKRPGPKGDEWLLPVAALVGLYREKETARPAPVPQDPGPAVSVDALLALADRLTALLEGERLQLRAAEQDRTDATAEAAEARVRLEMVEADLERERTRAAELAAELEREQSRRRFRRRRR